MLHLLSLIFLTNYFIQYLPNTGNILKQGIGNRGTGMEPQRSFNFPKNCARDSECSNMLAKQVTPATRQENGEN